MSWYAIGAISAALAVVSMAIIGWIVSRGAENAPITRDLDRHQDPDNYA